MFNQLVMTVMTVNKFNLDNHSEKAHISFQKLFTTSFNTQLQKRTSDCQQAEIPTILEMHFHFKINLQ